MAKKSAIPQAAIPPVAHDGEHKSVAKQQGFPLFYEKPAAIEKVRHASSGLHTQVELRFARATNSLAVNVLEFLEVAKHYPIVFTDSEAPLPLAIVGLEQENYFINAEGKWQEDCYIPAYVRQYPFILFENAADKKFVLCVDEKSPHFRANGGEGTTALFNEDGTPSPMTNQALEFCSAYYRHHMITRSFTADLKKHNLLAPYNSQMTLESGRQISLSGFQMIDETAFNALSDEVFLEFRKKGWLPFIDFALGSMSNWRRLAVRASR
jgi:hypothetical protein